MRCFTAALTVSLLVPLSTLSAQRPPTVEVGQRVRISQCRSVSPVSRRIVCDRSIGILSTLSADSVTVLVGDNAGELAIALDSVTRLDASRGQRRRVVRGALTGLGVGAGVGALLGAGAFAGSCIDSSEGCPAAGAAAGAIVFGGSGLVIGTVVGTFSKADRWQEVPLDRLRVSFAPQRDGRYALGVTLRF